MKKKNQRIYKHRKCLRDYYKENGVGKTVAERYKYWDELHTKNGGWFISHNPTKQVCVWLFEEDVLQYNFPDDFVYC